MITDLKATELPGLKIEAIQQWERDSLLLLPSDMKEFYVIADGFSLTWCVKFNSKYNRVLVAVGGIWWC